VVVPVVHGMFTTAGKANGVAFRIPRKPSHSGIGHGPHQGHCIFTSTACGLLASGDSASNLRGLPSVGEAFLESRLVEPKRGGVGREIGDAHRALIREDLLVHLAALALLGGAVHGRVRLERLRMRRLDRKVSEHVPDAPCLDVLALDLREGLV
jgi:hypothetical protein